MKTNNEAIEAVSVIVKNFRNREHGSRKNNEFARQKVRKNYETQDLEDEE